METISVVIPIYKVESFLDRCIQSVVDQTYKDLEIILVDDGSPDNCPAMCDAWAEKDSRIQVIHKANGGLSDARNVGMSVATGECVAFVDSDDWIAPEMLERLLFAMEKDGSDIAACSVEMVWEDDTPSRMLTVKMDRVLNREEAQTALLKETLLKQPVWYKLYKRSLICDIPFEVGKYHEDVFWSYQAIGKAKKVSLIDYVGYFYTQRSGSIMGAKYSLSRLDALEAVEKRYEYLKQEFPSLAQDAKVSILAECIYHGQMALKDLNEDEKEKVFQKLKNTIKKYDFQYRDFIGRKLTHRIWLNLARCSLLLVCQLKNAMKVGL